MAEEGDRRSAHIDKLLGLSAMDFKLRECTNFSAQGSRLGVKGQDRNLFDPYLVPALLRPLH